MKTIRFSLDEKSIARAIKSLEVYERKLAAKNKTFIRRLTERGIEVFEEKYSETNADEYTDLAHDKPVLVLHGSYPDLTGEISFSGKSLLFIEFGTGIYYNTPVGTSPHPKGGELGMTIGGYRPGSKGRFEWWQIPSGEITNGIRARMPVWNAAQKMAEVAVSVAQEVYGGT